MSAEPFVDTNIWIYAHTEESQDMPIRLTQEDTMGGVPRCPAFPCAEAFSFDRRLRRIPKALGSKPTKSLF